MTETRRVRDSDVKILSAVHAGIIDGLAGEEHFIAQIKLSPLHNGIGSEADDAYCDQAQDDHPLNSGAVQVSIARTERAASSTSNPSEHSVHGASNEHQQSSQEQPAHPSAMPLRAAAGPGVDKWAKYKASEFYDSQDGLLADLDREQAFINRDDDALLAKAKQAQIQADDKTPLICVNRSATRSILANTHLDIDDRVALQWFLKSFRASEWRKRQKMYPERVGICLLSSWDKRRDLAYCKYKGGLCKQPDYCPQCALSERIKPALKQYENAYESLLPDGSRRYWYAVSPSYDWNPERAGLKFVIKKGDPKTGKREKVLRHHPWSGQPPVGRMTSDFAVGKENELVACFRAIFGLAEQMAEAHEIGILAHRHVAFHFFEAQGYDHYITPNGHFLLTSPQPLTFDIAKNMLELFASCYRDQKHGARLYTDLHIEALCSQAEINRWIGYMFQPMNFVTPYMAAVRRGVKIEALNYVIDDRIFQGGNSLLCVPSPRRYGNLSVKGRGYFAGKGVTQQREEAKAARAATRAKRSGASTHTAAINYLEQQSLAQGFANAENAS